MEFMLIFVAGIVVGMIIILLISMFHLVGALRVDQSDPDEPYIFLELDKGKGSIAFKKYIVLKVNLKNFIPHK